MSPDADPGSGMHPTFQGSSDGSLQLSQGATMYLDWICEVYYNGYPQGPCPPSTITDWTTGSIPGGFQGGFQPTVTSGGGVATEWFTVQPQTAPGVYGLYACAAISYNGYYVTCVPFSVQVVSWQSTPLPSPPPKAVLGVKLQISKAGSPNGPPIPGQGHLYVEYYLNKVPFTALQAGCLFKGNPIACVTGDGSTLVTAKFPEFPLTQPGVDISDHVNQFILTARYNEYQYYQGLGEAPPYIAASMNSNSWADGLLGFVPQSDIDGWVTTLKNRSGLSPTAYENGNRLQRCFQSLDRALQLGGAPATTCETGNR